LPARNRKKILPISDFQEARLGGSRRARLQDFDSMSDSQFCDKRMPPLNRRNSAAEQIKSRLSDLTRTQSPQPRMRDNPFIARRLFCPVIQGSPSSPETEQTKPLKRQRAKHANVQWPAFLQVDVTILQQIDGNPLRIATRLAFDCRLATPVPTLNGSAALTGQRLQASDPRVSRAAKQQRT
jgi:hypothetical protein